MAGILLGAGGVRQRGGPGQRAGAVPEQLDRPAQRGDVVAGQPVGVGGDGGKRGDRRVALGQQPGRPGRGPGPCRVAGGQGDADQFDPVGGVGAEQQQPAGQPAVQLGQRGQRGGGLAVGHLYARDGPGDVLGRRGDAVGA